jgi:hypothetical protein
MSRDIRPGCPRHNTVHAGAERTSRLAEDSHRQDRTV